MWFDRSVKALVAQYEARLTENQALVARLDRDVDDRRIRIAALEAELESMRMVMLPMSSAQGAAYARSKAVRNTPTQLISEAPPNTDWQSFLSKHMTELEKENTDGTHQRENGKTVHEP